MFEELYRMNGSLHIPVDEYEDGQTRYEIYPVTYFSRDGSFLDESGTLQSETVIFCKGCELPVPAGARFETESGEILDIAVANRIFDHFENGFECCKFTVRK